MKATLILSFAATVMASVLEKRGCNADNCARQVTGTRPGLTPIESRKADCTSFMTATVIPEPTTTTVTVTVDEDDEPPKGNHHKPTKAKHHEARCASTEQATAVPAYASSCDTGVRYSSVCSCWGITAAVTTAPTPTETKTETVTTSADDYCEDL